MKQDTYQFSYQGLQQVSTSSTAPTLESITDQRGWSTALTRKRWDHPSTIYIINSFFAPTTPNVLPLPSSVSLVSREFFSSSSRPVSQKMDFILDVADHFALDNMYAKLVPVAAFLPPPTVNGTTWEHSTWQQLVSYLPHPPFPYEVYRAYPEQFFAPTSAWPRDYIPRQCLSLIVTTLIGVHLLYFLFSTFSYYFVFDHDMMKHPRFLKNQVRQEIVMSLQSFPVMMLLTLPWFEAEVLGYTRLYDNVDEYGWAWFFLSVPAYVHFSGFLPFFLRC